MNIEAIKGALKRSNTIVGLYKDFISINNRVLNRNNNVVREYFNRHSIKKLQIGGGDTQIPGWLTTDIITSARVSYLDAAKPFPYADETFDYVFSEHMIEHTPWKDGLQMLRECKRVLKGKGIVRIATPDLAVLVKVYREEGGEPAKKYVKWITDRYLTDIST